MALTGCFGESNKSGSSQNIAPPPPPPPPASGRLANGTEARTLDGTQNNIANPAWGSTFIQLRRLGPVAYADGISTLAGPLRASAREISNTVIAQGGADIPNDFGTSDFLWQWGQFLDHDMDLTDGVLDTGPNGRDFDIPVPTGDPFFDPMSMGGKVIEFNRALFDPSTGDSLANPREQENEITSWIDASNVYGSDDERLEALRVGPNSPYLRLSSDGLLPLNTDNLRNANGPNPFPETLFLAGDVRANEQVGLTVMHTLFMREHNRLADEVAQVFPLLDAEEVFFVTRRLVGAQMQIITYQEFLPALLGPNAMPPYTGYDASVDGSIINEFSVAAFRFGHTALSSTLPRLGADLQPIAAGNLPLREAFFNAPALLQTGADIEPFLRGLAMQPHQKIDTKLIDDVRNFLFGPPGSGGFDLASLNIQRGRDHGVPSYNDMREAVGLPRVTDFDEISSDPAVQMALQTAYGTVDDIDLWVGGLAEDPRVDLGSQLGDLFTAILVEQFVRLRDGDRFWWERDLSPVERGLVQNVTLADIIRRNTNIGAELQDDVFRVPTP